MPTYFKKQTCSNCGKNYDPTFQKCPHCETASDNPGSLLFKHHLTLPIWKQLVLFGVGLIGLQILATIVTIILGVAFRAQHPELAGEELLNALSAYLSSGEGVTLTFGITYPVIFVAIGLILFKDWKGVIHSFKNWKGVLIGAGAFGALYLLSYLYSLMLIAIFGQEVVGNANQGNVDAMIQTAPVLCIFVLGLIGPFVEEITYRVGLFGFTARLGKWVGYVITTLVFAFLHFDFTCFFNGGQAILVEFVNLPFYLIAGVTMTFLYDRFGFASSFTCHALNNILSVILTMVETKA